jgi:hypothetical protein
LEQVTLGQIIVIAALFTSLLSIASFYLGRKNAATTEGKFKGSLESDLTNIKETMRCLTLSFQSLTTKIETQSETREKEYRDILIKMNTLELKYDALNERINELARTEGGNK